MLIGLKQKPPSWQDNHGSPPQVESGAGDGFPSPPSLQSPSHEVKASSADRGVGSSGATPPASLASTPTPHFSGVKDGQDD